MLSCTGRLIRGLGVALVAVALAASGALAQGGGGGGGRRGGGGMMAMGGMQLDAPLEAGDLDRIAKMAGMSKEQTEAAKALLEGYLPEFNAEAEKQRRLLDELREQFRETRDPSVWQDAQPKFQSFFKFRGDWEKKVLADVSGLLTPEQSGAWPRVERMRRRAGTIQARSFLAGERVDLVEMVDELGLSKEQAADILPTIEAYELELDRALVERNQYQEESMAQAAELMRNQEMEKLQAMFAAGMEKAQKVRDVNRKFARQLQNMVPPEKKDKFELEFKRQSFPMVYREYYPRRALDAALAMGELEPTQRDAITALSEGYGRDEAALNARHEKAWDENESGMSIGRMFMGGMGQSEALREIRTARTGLETETLNKLKAILSPEQFAKLPERRQLEEGGERPRNRMRQGGGAGGADGGAGTPANTPTSTPAAPK
jgi:hypothetical protein